MTTILEPSWFVQTYHFFSAPCTSSAYQKNDGKYYCTFAIKDSLTWYQADDACKLRGGWLPEVYSVTENINILRQKVLNHHRNRRDMISYSIFCPESLKMLYK